MPNTERVVPISFEGYVDRFFVRLEEPCRCSGCLDGPAIASDNANHYCEACLRYSWGYDQAEEKMVRSSVAAVISAALDAGTARQTIERAVEAAMAATLSD